jgi:hypothetical protein
MKRLVMVPDGWPCKLGELRPGFFVWNDMLGFKPDHKAENGKQIAFSATGESLWYKAGGFEPMVDLMVQPAYPGWEDYSE